MANMQAVNDEIMSTKRKLEKVKSSYARISELIETGDIDALKREGLPMLLIIDDAQVTFNELHASLKYRIKGIE
jgi:hypothetical protein